jgi:hypothetical protein
MNAIEEIKRFIMSGDAEFTLKSKAADAQYNYRVRSPYCSGKKGLYFITVSVDGKWLYMGHVWRSTLTLLRGIKSDFSWNDGQMKTFKEFLDGLRYEKIPGHITLHNTNR